MIVFVADIFSDQYAGGAELTTEALLQSSYVPCRKVLSRDLTIEHMKELKDSFWVFTNFTGVAQECILYAAQNLKYTVVEYDYKFCSMRSPEKHIALSGDCDCREKRVGKLTSIFFSNAKVVWWMSHGQMQRYFEEFPFLEKANNKVLSSVFSEETLKTIYALDTSKKNDKWLIFKSSSWIKGTDSALFYAKENGLKYELVGGISYDDFLKKMASSKGVIFLPLGADTCPRMIIEAKLLDCELILNENVQHKNEEWFDTKDSCKEYLQERTEFFWSNLEDYIDFLPNKNPSKDNRFVFVVPFYNAESYISKCIESIKRQHHQDFVCFLVDDMSSDKTYETAAKAIGSDSRFKLRRATEKSFALKNIADTLNGEELFDEDIVILLDGDDWISSANTLDALNFAYDSEGALVTYGSYVLHPYAFRGPEPSTYPKEVVESNGYREDSWRASHLRTFKHSLWKKIRDSDLRDESGKYYEVAYDQAVMLPLLELAGHRAKYIDSILHTYNKENPLNVDKNKAQKQSQTAAEIRKKARYESVN